MTIAQPYLLFLADAPHAKTAFGVRHWRPEACAAQFRYPGSALDLALPEMTPAQAAAAGVRTLLIGAAPAGGMLPERWIADLVAALRAGMDIASGLHARLTDVPELVAEAKAAGRRLHDVRHPTESFTIGGFERRPGKRLITVGADCAVGKMYTALAIERELRARAVAADFRATGQTGILIVGSGISVDAVISDFVAAAAASLSPAAAPDHWDVVEGQGSLFHPAYAGVTLGLLHGSQPDAMVLCADPSRTTLGDFDAYPQPDLAECVTRYTDCARLTNPDARVVGVSLNTSAFSAAAAEALIAQTADRLGLPCVDPVRTGVAAIVDRLDLSGG
ncbi:MAG: EBNA-1 nuclear protein [Sphingomonas sp. SCN 67-18]|uniref:DUF1611 domain-containing protein n=1 Tax=uncultured Sphingomonas sp. TaxID=158754 RepID=UPI00086BF870|nr:DUF1611 domain-containing protein [Sphingomonas sp. SCN 67-18]ODU21614.1 MAG: EBNA-1 nuclear protein [Sphingomonas sp. SCN 67-18]